MNPREVRDLFESSRQARQDLDHRRERLVALRAASVSSGIPQAIQGGVSDPTATLGQALADMDGEEQRRTESLLLSRIARAKRLCSGVRRCFRMAAGDVLEDYYVNGLSWAQVAALNSVGRTSAIRLRDVAFEWIATVGEAKAVAGEGMAQDAD